MKKIFIILTIILPLSLFASFANSASLYVRSGATGTSCNGWGATAACGQVTTALALANRGDVIYVADGTYNGFTFSEAASGSTWVTVQKATVSTAGRGGTAHGTDTDWLSSYGDGQAVFTSKIEISAPYFHFDGVVGGGAGSWTSGHGFKVSLNSGTLINYSAAGTNAYITIEHVELTHGTGWDSGDVGDAIFGTSGTINHVILSHIWSHEIARVVLYHNDGSNVLLQNSYLETQCGMSIYNGTHCEHVVTRGLDDFIVRYNIFKDARSTGWLVVNLNSGDNWEIYGNVFGDSPDAGGTVFIFHTDSDDFGCSWKVFNNSFVRAPFIIPVNCASSDTSYLYNNVFYYGIAKGVAWGVAGLGEYEYEDYNYFSRVYLDTTCGTYGEHDTPVSQILYDGKDRCWSTIFSDPFVSWSTDDYRLSAPLSGYAGLNLNSLAGSSVDIAGDTIVDSYNLDMFGRTRGADGTWDRGAVEYVSGGDATPPVCTITSPTTSPTYSTAVGTVDISGTASDNTEVTSVTWSNNRGGSGICTGTTSWSQSAITLYEGSNIITVTAMDAASNSHADTLTIDYTVLDVTAPVLSSPLPSGTVSCTQDPQPISLQVTTNEAATAKYSLSNQSYDDMTTIFSSTGGTSHSQPLSLACGASYTYYAQAVDASGNKTSVATTISFSIGDAVPDPVVFISGTRFGENSSASISAVCTDTYLSSVNQTSKYFSASSLYVQTDGESVPVATVPIKFDLSSIPTNATVNDARLYVYVSFMYGSASLEITAHPMENYDWATPALATWLTYNGTNAWTANGALSDIGAAEDTETATEAPGWIEFTIPTMVAGWVATPANNLGVLLATDQGSNHAADNTYCAIASSQYADTSLRPILIVDYTVPAPANKTISGSGTLTLTPGGGGTLTFSW